MENASAGVGIIGGADGPTAIFVTEPVWMLCVIPTLALMVRIWEFLRLSRYRQK